MDAATRGMIAEYGPMWTAKQVWEYERGRGLLFDVSCEEPGGRPWNPRRTAAGAALRDAAVDMYGMMEDGGELWVARGGRAPVPRETVPYVMAVLADVVSGEEAPLRFRLEGGFVVASIDAGADLVDCREFFEEFYHMAAGAAYEHSGIPDDETEAGIHVSRMQEEFDARMAARLGGAYMPGNSDPGEAA